MFNCLLALDDRDYESWDKGKISWHVRYQRTASRTLRHFETSKNAASATSSSSMQADQPTMQGGDADKLNEDDDAVRSIVRLARFA